MKRSGFKPKVYVRPPKSPLKPLQRTTLAVHGAMTVFRPQPKFTYIESKALLVACRTIVCQHCFCMDGTVCAAHSNWSVHGKGKGIKASDQYIASLCSRCHWALDQGSKMAEADRQFMWWCAHQRTVLKLLQFGRWPVEVPVPDIVNYPF